MLYGSHNLSSLIAPPPPNLIANGRLDSIGGFQIDPRAGAFSIGSGLGKQRGDVGDAGFLAGFAAILRASIADFGESAYGDWGGARKQTTDAGVTERMRRRNDETGTGEQREGGAAVYVHPGGDASSEDALNLPLGTETAPPGFPAATPCIVKMYDDEDDVKLNDVLELVGVLGIAPALAQEMQDMSAEPFGVFATEPAAAAAANGAAPPNANADASVDFEFMDEARAHNPPTSVVPRFHVLAARRASPQSFAVAALDSGAVEDAERAESHDPHDPSLRVDGSGGWGLRPLDGAFCGPPLVPSLARRGVEVREKLSIPESDWNQASAKLCTMPPRS